MFLSPELLDSRSITAFTLGSVTSGAVGAAVCAEQSILVPLGTPALRTTDLVIPALVTPTGNATALVSARVVDATHIGLTYCNPTAGGLTPAISVVNVVVVRT
jgi:hypothetical protein